MKTAKDREMELMLEALKHQLCHQLPPVKDAILYHYCSSQTLISILTHKTIRACDVDKMNDYLEFKWGLEVFRDACTLAEKETSKEFITEITELVNKGHLDFVAAVSCFSTDGDVLSQWRAYAGDGSGFSIGFSTEALRKFPGNLYHVIYDRGEQLSILRKYLGSEHSRWSKLKDDKDKGIYLRLIVTNILCDLCLFKNPAFSEEKEVRFVFLLHSEELGDDSDMITNPAGDDDHVNFSYLPKGDLLVPYCDLTSREPTAEWISEVVIGPRNRSTHRDVNRLLNHHGAKGFSVRKSSASYRQ